MNIDELKEYRKKLGKLTEEERKKRDLYLKKLANGTLQGPLTGKQSIDKTWLKYYEDESILASENLNMSLAEEMEKSATEYSNMPCMKYMKSIKSYKDTKKMGDMVAASLKANGVKPKDKVTVCLPCVPEFGYFLYAINKVGAISNWLDFRTSEEELKECMKDIDSKIVVTFDGVCDKVNNAIKIHNDNNDNKIRKVVKVSPSDSLPFPI